MLSLPSLVAPTKVLLVPLSKSPEFTLKVRKLSARLRSLGVSHNIDDTSASTGKRYSRNDELEMPFGVTVDFESLRDGMITLRDRDSMKQVRASSDEINLLSMPRRDGANPLRTKLVAVIDFVALAGGQE